MIISILPQSCLRLREMSGEGGNILSLSRVISWDTSFGKNEKNWIRDMILLN